MTPSWQLFAFFVSSNLVTYAITVVYESWVRRRAIRRALRELW